MKRTVDETANGEEKEEQLATTLPRDIWNHFARCMLGWVQNHTMPARVALRFFTAVGNASLLKRMLPIITKINTAPRCALCCHDLMAVPLRMHPKKRGRPRLIESLAGDDDADCSDQYVLSATGENGLCRGCAIGRRCAFCSYAHCFCLLRYAETCMHCGDTICGRCASEPLDVHRDFSEEVDPNTHCAGCCRDRACREAHTEYV